MKMKHITSAGLALALCIGMTVPSFASHHGRHNMHHRYVSSHHEYVSPHYTIPNVGVYPPVSQQESTASNSTVDSIEVIPTPSDVCFPYSPCHA